MICQCGGLAAEIQARIEQVARTDRRNRFPLFAPMSGFFRNRTELNNQKPPERNMKFYPDGFSWDKAPKIKMFHVEQSPENRCLS